MARAFRIDMNAANERPAGAARHEPMRRRRLEAE